jgi:hypothetical protein
VAQHYRTLRTIEFFNTVLKARTVRALLQNSLLGFAAHIVLHHDDVLANDLEIQKSMDLSEGVVHALDEEGKIPIEESVSTIISDLNPSDWFYTLED